MNKIYLYALIVLLICTAEAKAQDTGWPAVQTQAKPGTRWWWMGSAVDKENISRNIQIYANAGLGSLEITPIYGVKGNEANEIPYLSDQWMEILAHTQKEAKANGIFIDMNTGTGWPFGGPDVTIQDAASKLLISKYHISGNRKVVLNIVPTDEKDRKHATLSKLMAFSEKGTPIDLTHKVVNNHLQWNAPQGNWLLIAAFCGKTLQKVKRAAPGGEGYVMNHLDARAVGNYLNKFDVAFSKANTPYPHNFFNDSYEVYQADWTEDFFEQFSARRGYKLEEYLPAFLYEEDTDLHARLRSDYRETIAEILRENFTLQWTEWAHKHGSQTRNQAHGSPGNLIDLYATVDIPECEGFGLSDFGIKGLRKDSLTRPNDSDISMLKYASSAAHIAGKTYTSSETFTWLTEHFRTSLSQCKPDMDLMFLSGVNRMYFHGTTYSPLDAQWPGWKFYASIDMSPTNSIWKDAPAFFDYITRCQSFLQMGQPDNDFLLYLPLYDMWYEQGGRLLMFDIHSMKQRAPRFIEAVNQIISQGYDVDYISDNFIRSLQTKDGMLKTAGGGKYKALIVPKVKFMPHDVLQKLAKLAQEGATIVFSEQYPQDVPGLGNLEERRRQFNQSLSKMRSYGKTTLAQTNAIPEKMKTQHGISYIRRANNEGHHYFISALNNADTDAWVPLSVKAQSVMIYNPMNGKSGKAKTRTINGITEVYIQLKSGQSLILKTFAQNNIQAQPWPYLGDKKRYIEEPDTFDLTFVQSNPAIDGKYELKNLSSWTELDIPHAKTTMATGRYTFGLNVDSINPGVEWILDLGDVRESARVYVNGQEAAVLWAVPFECGISKYLKTGYNTIEVDVTNLPANRIADMDRKSIEWRNFKDINIVDIHYKTTGYANWTPVLSGLLGPVRIYTAVSSPSICYAQQKTNNGYEFPSVPDGNYKITLLVGSEKEAGITTVRAESRRLFINNLATAKGQFIERSFVVNKRNTQITEDEQVRIKPREKNKLNWDDKLSIEVTGSAPQIASISIEKVDDVTTVFLCGNSTVVDQEEEPWASWGQMIPAFFNDRVAFANYAESGESANTFIAAGRLKKALTQIKPGDYMFIEFGHNDQKQKGPGKGAYYSYMTSLKTFVDEVRLHGAYPVLVTPTQRRSFNAEGKIVDTHEDFPEAMKFLAAKENIPLIDLHSMTRTLYEALGVEKSKEAFVHYPANTFPGQEKALEDNTHFNSYGAYEIAKCVVEGIKKLNLLLVKDILPDYIPFDPSIPDDAGKFRWDVSSLIDVQKPDGD